MCDSLGNERFSTTRWAIEKNTLGRTHAKLFEFVGIERWKLNNFFERTFNVVKASNVVPTHVRHFNHSFTECTGIGCRKSEMKVGKVDLKRSEKLGIDHIVVKVDFMQTFTDALKCSFCSQFGKIRTNKSVCVRCNFVEIDVFRHLHVFGVNAQNFVTALFVWNTNFYFFVKTTISSECRIDRIGSVGSSHDNHLSTAFETIHEREKLRDDTTFCFTLGFATLGCNSINLIEEND
mmetsp:Transcript_11058/g.16590  ORF Transcript_11058/g.16590 Transcript_11058/m.16590 type:complete len:235 (+) Transcript_11058:975-1679(+)